MCGHRSIVLAGSLFLPLLFPIVKSVLVVVSCCHSLVFNLADIHRVYNHPQTEHSLHHPSLPLFEDVGPVYLTGYTVSVLPRLAVIFLVPLIFSHFSFHCTAWALASLTLIFISLMPRVQNATRGCVIFMWHPLIGSRD